MKNWKKYASLLLALVMCLSLTACGGNDNTAPDTIKNLVLDSSVEYDYSVFFGTWSGKDDTVLAVEKYDDGRVHYTLSDANDDWIASGILQYVEEYGVVYAHNDYDATAYLCTFNDDDTLNIASFFGTFTKKSGAEVNLTVFSGTWYLDGDVNATTTIEIANGNWVLWEQEVDGMWSLVDSGTLNATEDGDYEALSEFLDQTYYINLTENNGMYWDDDYFVKGE